MARPTATPDSRMHRYGHTPGRPLSDWAVLKHVWEDSATARQACGDSFTKFEMHAYAEPRLGATADGRALTELIWDEMKSRSIKVTKFGGVHFHRTPRERSQLSREERGATIVRDDTIGTAVPVAPRSKRWERAARALRWIAGTPSWLAARARRAPSDAPPPGDHRDGP